MLKKERTTKKMSSPPEQRLKKRRHLLSLSCPKTKDDVAKHKSIPKQFDALYQRHLKATEGNSTAGKGVEATMRIKKENLIVGKDDALVSFGGRVGALDEGGVVGGDLKKRDGNWLWNGGWRVHGRSVGIDRKSVV